MGRQIPSPNPLTYLVSISWTCGGKILCFCLIPAPKALDPCAGLAVSGLVLTVHAYVFGAPFECLVQIFEEAVCARSASIAIGCSITML